VKGTQPSSHEHGQRDHGQGEIPSAEDRHHVPAEVADAPGHCGLCRRRGCHGTGHGLTGDWRRNG